MEYTLAATTRRLAAAAALAALVAGCSNGGTGVEQIGIIRNAEAVAGGTLRQRVDVSVVGDTLNVRSVLQNIGGAAADISVRICGLDIEPNLPLAGARCGAVSMLTTLAPGDSLVEGDRRLHDHSLTSINVRHLLSPEFWVTVSLR